MAVAVQVRQVREELYRAAGGPEAVGDGEPSTVLLGRLFHELFAELVDDDSPLYWPRALADAPPTLAGWQAQLIHEAYRKSVGPKLGQERAALRETTAEVLAFWEAAQGLCRWMAELLWTAREFPTIREKLLSAQTGVLLPDSAILDLVKAEQPLTLELREPGWTDSVRLTGVADCLWRLPGQGDWCIVELKLGRGVPEVDLGQATLYHLMLTSGPGQSRLGHEIVDRSLALVSFGPERRERVFKASELTLAAARLKDLIGQVAGVVPIHGMATETFEPQAASASSMMSTPARGSMTLFARESGAEDREMGQRVAATCKEFGAPIEILGEPIVGPSFVRFQVATARRVRRGALEKLAPELQMRLGLSAAPFISQAGGQMVIDVERKNREIVPFARLRGQLPRIDPLCGSAKVPLGIDLFGRLQFADLAEPSSAHLLVAGTSGSGKSEWLRTALAGLMLSNTPETLRLVLIDPKRNAFGDLKNSRFLQNVQAMVYPDERSAVEVLERLADEMDVRYRLLEKARADSLREYVRISGTPVPRIVCVVDEYFELINRDRQERKELETQICRLGAKARAAGIHLMLATQQPSRETIKGALESNIAARVGLMMKNRIESRMLLGQSGAENLLGAGDLLYKNTGEPIRLQAPLMTRDERAQIFAGESRELHGPARAPLIDFVVSREEA